MNFLQKNFVESNKVSKKLISANVRVYMWFIKRLFVIVCLDLFFVIDWVLRSTAKESFVVFASCMSRDQTSPHHIGLIKPPTTISLPLSSLFNLRSVSNFSLCFPHIFCKVIAQQTMSRIELILMNFEWRMRICIYNWRTLNATSTSSRTLFCIKANSFYFFVTASDLKCFKNGAFRHILLIHQPDLFQKALAVLYSQRSKYNPSKILDMICKLAATLMSFHNPIFPKRSSQIQSSSRLLIATWRSKASSHIQVVHLMQ